MESGGFTSSDWRCCLCWHGQPGRTTQPTATSFWAGQPVGSLPRSRGWLTLFQRAKKPVAWLLNLPLNRHLPPLSLPVPTATRRPTPTPSLSAEDREILIGRMVHVLVNEVRSSNGVPPLEYDVALAQVARNHSLDMVARDYYSHDNPDGEGPSERASRQGYHCRRDFGLAYSIGVAENIFHGYGLAYSTMPPAEVAIVAMKSWMGSSGHRANILDRDYSKEGVGVAVAGRTVYFTQNFC